MASMLDPAAISKVLGISEATLVHWRARGVGPKWSRRGRYIYYRADRFQDYLAEIGPIPEGLDAWGRRRFFVTAHEAEVAPEEIPETVEHKATVAELANQLAVAELALGERLAAVERALVKLKPKRKRVYIKRRKVRVRVPNDSIPY